MTDCWGPDGWKPDGGREHVEGDPEWREVGNKEEEEEVESKYDYWMREYDSMS